MWPRINGQQNWLVHCKTKILSNTIAVQLTARADKSLYFTKGLHVGNSIASLERSSYIPISFYLSIFYTYWLYVKSRGQ